MGKKRSEFTEDQEAVAKDLDRANALEAMALSAGGKMLSDGLLKDIVSDMDSLAVRFKELTLQEFVGICADMKTKLDMFRIIARAPKNKKFLLGVLKEALGENEGGE